MVSIVDEVIGGVERQEWARVKALLHPYLHWTEPGVVIRGRVKVLAHLAGRAKLAAPVSYEVRDGQVYRWDQG